MNKNNLFFVFLFFSSVFSVKGGEDFQYWSQFSKGLYKQGGLDLRFYTEGRFNNDARDALGYFFGPTVQYKVNSTVSFGGAVKMIHFKIGGDFARLQRYEGEMILNFKLFPWLKFQGRNRFEYFRWEERADSKRWRMRLRFTVPKRAGMFEGFFFGNEFFYNPGTKVFERNRLTPIGVNLKLGVKSSIKIYYLIEYIKSTSVDNQVLGTYLNF